MTAPNRTERLLSMVALVLVACAALGMLLGGIGTRLDWWYFRTGLTIFRYAGFGAVAALNVAIVAMLLTMLRRGNRALGLAALLLSLLAAWGPITMFLRFRSSPIIHDISTDTENPPPFVATAAMRGKDQNPAEYDGAEVAGQQKAAYPDIQPLVVNVPVALAQETAYSVAKDAGWEIVATAPDRIEATDTTLLFGFKDDVVVRLHPEGTGTRIDVRSKSRVGKSDLGTNARRVRKFLAALRKQLDH